MDTENNGRTLLQQAQEQQRKLQSVNAVADALLAEPGGVPFEDAGIKAVVDRVANRLAVPARAEPTEEQKEKWRQERLEYERGVAEMQKNQEQHRRIGAWRDIEREMGPKHANASLKGWEYFGTDEAQKAQRENIEKLKTYLRGMETNLIEGKNIVWSGSRGTGKDHQMSACLRNAILGHGSTAKWMLGANLFMALRGTMVKGSAQTEQELIRSLCKVPILALSDPLPTVGGLTGFQADALLAIVDERYRHQRPIWCTLNIESRADAESRLGALLVDRLFEHSLILFSSWPSYRQHMQAKEAEQEAANGTA